MNLQIIEKLSTSSECVGKIALFGKALVSALARGALTMCAMWVGFPSFFCGWEKKQNKFPSNLHCPIKGLNSAYKSLNLCQFCRNLLGCRDFFTLVANGGGMKRKGFNALQYLTAK